jgi:pimeloyl-ACP methyl ester carboxylesterase
MADFVFVHGAWGTPAELAPAAEPLRAAGHRVDIVDLPCTDPAATLTDYRDTVLATTGDREDVILVGHSFGGASIGLVHERRPELPLVYVTALALAPGESLLDVFAGGAANPDDPFAPFEGLVIDTGDGLCELDLEIMASVMPEDQRAEYLEALRRTQRRQGVAALAEGWPGSKVPSGRIWYVVATNDTLILPQVQRSMAGRLGATVLEVATDHEMFIEAPVELAGILDGIARETQRQS